MVSVIEHRFARDVPVVRLNIRCRLQSGDVVLDSFAGTVRLLKPNHWFSIVFQHWDASYFATILEAADAAGANLKAAITQTGDVVWSMHKKKNSASVLAGEMILTFHKPKRHGNAVSRPSVPPAELPQVLDGLFDELLRNGQTEFTSETLFNRLIIELWHRRALGCLNLDRREFASRLEERGWAYDTRRHCWTRGERTAPNTTELALPFDTAP